MATEHESTRRLPALILGLMLFPVVTRADLVGRVVDRLGKPVPGVVLQLELQKLSATSDAQGRFVFKGAAGIIRATRTHPDREDIRAVGSSLLFATRSGEASSASLYSVEGRLAARFDAPKAANATPGAMAWDFRSIVPALPQGIYALELQSAAPHQRRTLALEWDGKAVRMLEVTGNSLVAGGPALAKPAAGGDTLALAKPDFLPRRVLAADGRSDLGDITLYPGFAVDPVDYKGFRQYDFTVAGKKCLVVAPNKPAVGNPWIWRTYFWNHKPRFDSIMCARGYYLAFMDAPNLFGAPEAVTLLDSMYAQVTARYGLNKKTILVGISRGGLYAYNWARSNLGKVACIYGDAPVMDFVSWPCGCYGTGSGSGSNWTLLKRVYGFSGDAPAKAFKGNPYQGMKAFAEARIPMIHVLGDTDLVVPVDENTLKANDSLKAHGWKMVLLRKPNTGHVHGLSTSDGGLSGQMDSLINFVVRNSPD